MNPRKNNPFLRISPKLLPFGIGLAIAAPLYPTSAFADDGTWANSASGAGNWSDPGRWVDNIIADGIGATGNFNLNYGSNNKTITIDTTSRTLGTLNIGDPGQTYWKVTIAASGGANLTFDNGGAGALLSKTTATNTQNDEITAPVTLADNLTIHSTDTTANSNVTIAGIVSESGGARNILKTGSGQAALSGANTHTGTTTIEDGILGAGNAGALGNATSPIALGNANSIDNHLNPKLLMSGVTTITRDVVVGASNAETFGTYMIGTGNASGTPSGITGTVTLNQNLIVSATNLQGDRVFNLAGGGITSGSSGMQTVTFNNSNNATSSIVVSGVIGGGVGTIELMKGAGTGATILTNANTYTGDTLIFAGVLQLGNGGATGSLSPSSQIFNNGTLAFNRTDTVTQGTDFAPMIDGLGAVRKAGAGTLILNSANTYEGGTTVNAGTLSLDTNGTLGTGPLVVQNQNALAATAVVLNLATGMDTTVGSLSGTIAAATPADPPNTVTINTGGSGRNFIVNQTAELAYNGVIAGEGNFILGDLSTNILSLNGANTYTGTTTIESGTLLAGNPSALGNATSPIALGSANSISYDLSPRLQVNGNNTVTRDITVGASNGETFGTYTIGTGNVNSSSTINGTVTLNQDLTVAATNQAGGTFTLAGSVTSGSAGTQTVTFNHTNQLVASTTISDGVGTIAVTKNGPGTTTLGGANTYTGATAVNAGTLVLLGSLASDVTVADVATLRLQIGSPASTTGTVTFVGGSTVNVIGTPAATTLMTAASFVGVPSLFPEIPGWKLEVDGTRLNLVATGSDYDSWIDGFTFDEGADKTPTGDPDGDGLANRQEYAFGLLPNSGSSVNPITSPLDKTTGQFTYTRRKQSLTGLDYGYQYSTTLAGWSSFVPTMPPVSDNGDPIESITVTAPVEVTGNPKVFIRVSASE